MSYLFREERSFERHPVVRVQEGALVRTQRDRGRLVIWKKVQKRLITQAMAASKLQVSGRQVRWLRAKPAAPGGRGADAGTTELK